MDAIWECMNIASRIGKQIENTDNLVPKNQNVNCSPMTDLQELTTTVNGVRTTLVPFVTSSKKSKMISEPNFEICIKGIKDTLSDLFNFFKEMEKDFSIYTWKTQKVKVYQIDFSLKQKLDQFSALFNVEETKDKKKPPTGAHLISDSEGREMWIKSFGETTNMVPWEVFLSAFESYLQIPLKEDEEYLKMAIDFCKDNHVSSFEFGVFLKWFAPLKGSTQRYLEALRGGHLCGFIPAVEANLLLEGKRDGTYLVRYSKTQPGSFAVTFVDNQNKIKHCLLYSVSPNGVTLKNPPTVYNSLKEFSESHQNKLKHPLGNKWTLKNKMPGFAFDGKISEGMEDKSAPASGPANGGGLPTQDNTCVVCMDAPFETVFLECGHLACCNNCSLKLKLCPICRNSITRVVPIFRAT